jgi:C_GCAxxG_C_C family probable redox protein
MSRASEAAAVMSASHMNCAQSVLSVFATELGLDKTTALKIALGFGAGAGRTGGVCGAVSGAYMVIGLRQYPDISSAVERKEKVYSLVGEFNNKFKDIHRSIHCSDLLGCDLSTPQGLAAARSQKLFTTVCPGLVADAVTILEELAAV